MQLGTRWRAGEDPPNRLPATIVDAIKSVEAALPDSGSDALHWTLTWLEGRPVVELDTGTTIHQAPDGSVLINTPGGAPSG